MKNFNAIPDFYKYFLFGLINRTTREIRLGRNKVIYYYIT
jgi:hypothetical protein